MFLLIVRDKVTRHCRFWEEEYFLLSLAVPNKDHTLSALEDYKVDVFTVVAVTVGKTDGLVQHNFRRAAPGSFVLLLEKATKQLASPQLIVEEFICINGGRWVKASVTIKKKS